MVVDPDAERRFRLEGLFRRGIPKPSPLPEEVWINPPDTPTTGGIAH